MGQQLATLRHLGVLGAFQRPDLLLRALLGLGEVLTPFGNLVPRHVHVELRAPQQLNPEGRLVVVSDIHGCSLKLEQLLQQCQLTPTDRVLLVGDLVTKGPQSQQVLQMARERSFLAVRGNHDDAAVAAWHSYQRGTAPAPRHAWVTGLSRADVAQLESLPFSISLPDYGAVVVHAGQVPGVPLGQQTLANLTCMRELLADTDGRWQVFEKAGPPGSSAWAECWQGPQHILFGHDAKRRLQRAKHATGIDTGCVYGGALTAAILPPLSQLRNEPNFCSKLASGAPLTFEDLQGHLVSVPAAEVYAPPKGQ